MEELERYRKLAARSAAMARAAECSDWDSLAEIDAAMGILLREAETALPVAMPADLAREKARLIAQILIDQKTVREHVEPWLDAVRPLLTALGKPAQDDGA